MLNDLRYAARSLRRSWSFAIITVMTLGLGIGVITALFAVIDAVLLHPIAVDQDRVVRIWKRDAKQGLDRHPISYPEFRSWRDETRRFESLAAINYADASPTAIMVHDEPVPVALTPVSANFFKVVYHGPPLHGRWFHPEDELAGADLAAVVSNRFWRRAAGADPAFVGRRLSWAGGKRTLVVIGIAPPDVDYPLGTEMWVPIARFFGSGAGPLNFEIESRQFIQFELIGRLSPGALLEEARAELTMLDRRFAAQFPDDNIPMGVIVQPVLDTVLGNGRQVLLFLFAGAGLVFVVAGVNVAALLLMRAADRRHDVAVRLALGASRKRLARQTVTESALIGGMGAICGLLLAHAILGAVRLLAPSDVPRIEDTALNSWVLGFCVVAALGWVLALGTVPAWEHRRLAIAPGVEPLAQSFRGVRSTRGLRIFTVAEIAAAVVIAIAAGLLVRSFIHLQRLDRGFDARNLVVVSLLLPESRYPDSSTRLAFYERLLSKVTSIPGVIAASPVHMGPGSGIVGLSAPMRFEGQTPDDAAKNPWGTWEPVTPSYFRTLGVRIIRGRGFTNADSRDAAPVAIVSQAVARRYWPGQDPLGKRLQFTPEFPWVTVVGVVADLRYRELTKNWLTVYFPAAQFFFFTPGELVLRTASDPQTFVPAIREAIRTQEPHAALASISTMDALLATELSRPRTALTVTGAFALMSILLAAIGVYGVMSYEVRQRRRELAVRSALGASPARIFRSVVWRSLALGAAGTLVGLAAALAVARWLRSLVFELEPVDPSTFLAGAGALLAIVLVASYVPARRAATVDPVALLRTE